MPHRLETIGVDRWDRLFLTIVPEALRVFSNRPDSQHFGGPPSRTALSPPRSLMARGPSQTASEGGKPIHASRLPFPVRCDRAVDIDADFWPWCSGAAARGARRICQHPVAARTARDTVRAAGRCRG